MLQMIDEVLIKWNGNYYHKRALALVALLPAFENILQELDASEINGAQTRADMERSRTNLIQFHKLERDDLRAWELKSEIAAICVFTSSALLLLGFLILSLEYFWQARRQDRLLRREEGRDTRSGRRR